jgi:hypothetical protein
MRPQARPFSVEIKNRKRTAPPAPASAARQDDWIDAIPPDDVPERDVHADLADPAGQSEARRKAEWVFARLNGHAEPSETQNEAAPEEPTAPAPEAPAPRVLPDLLAGAPGGADNGREAEAHSCAEANEGEAVEEDQEPWASA